MIKRTVNHSEGILNTYGDDLMCHQLCQRPLGFGNVLWDKVSCMSICAPWQIGFYPILLQS